MDLCYLAFIWIAIFSPLHAIYIHLLEKQLEEMEKRLAELERKYKK